MAGPLPSAARRRCPATVWAGRAGPAGPGGGAEAPGAELRPPPPRSRVTAVAPLLPFAGSLTEALIAFPPPRHGAGALGALRAALRVSVRLLPAFCPVEISSFLCPFKAGELYEWLRNEIKCWLETSEGI